jgi:hypothetical protein
VYTVTFVTYNNIPELLFQEIDLVKSVNKKVLFKMLPSNSTSQLNQCKTGKNKFYTVNFLMMLIKPALGTTPLWRHNSLPFLNKINVGTPCTW